MKPVAIVGTNILTRSLIDWTLDADYWVFNEVAALDWPQRMDGSFQMHIPPLWRTKQNVNYEKYYEWLQQPHGKPVWMQDVYPDVPDSVRYPKDEITKKFIADRLVDENGNPIEVFTSTAAYALALALYQGRKTIYLFGIEMASDTEFVRQKPGFTFWCGLAAGLGVKIVKRSQSLLFQEKTYGYAGEVTISKEELEESIARMKLVEPASLEKLKRLKDNARILLDSAFSQKERVDIVKVINAFTDANNEVLTATFEHGQLIGGININNKLLEHVNAQYSALRDGESQEGLGIQRMQLELTLGRVKEEESRVKADAFSAEGASRVLIQAVPRMGSTEDSKLLANAFVDVQNQSLESTFRYGQAVGAIKELTRYVKECRDMIDAAGGERAQKMLLEK